MAQNIDQNRNNTDVTNIPIFCLPKRDEDFLYDENIQNFDTDHQSIQKCIRYTDVLESLLYDHNLNLNATKVGEFLSSEYDYVEFNIHASRIPNMICLKYEDNKEKQDIRTNSLDHRKENQENYESDRDSPLILQNIPKDTNKYMEVYAEIYPNDKCYIINKEIFFHLSNWHCIYRSNAGTTICFLCLKNIDPTMEGIKIHIEVQKHLEKLELMKKRVLTEFGYSIVTEVSSKKYFCGVCTMVFGSLNTVRVHCSNKKHVKSLEKRMDRAQRFLAELDKERVMNINTDNEDNIKNKNKLESKPKFSLNMTDVCESNELNDNALPPNTTKTNDAQQIVSDWRNHASSKRFMEVNVERVRSSFVINGQVSLLRRNWHTLAGTKKALFCVLCDEDVKNTQQHISDIEHTERLKLRSNNVLEEFGYSIVMETAKKGFYHCGVCNVIIHTLPGMRVHRQTKGHLKEYERLMYRAQRLLGKVAGQENGTTRDMPSVNGPELRPHESHDPTKKYMTVCSVKRDHASFMINKKIALVRSEWHGFLRRDGQYYCVLCQKDFSKMETHMKNRYHKQLMGDKVRRILAEFGYGIVCETPVKDLYHCAVCNVLIQGISTVRVHAVTEKHLLLIEKHIEKAKRILERVPRIYYREDCVLRRGTFYGDDEFDSVLDVYVDF